jgi:hypothetical protein
MQATLYILGAVGVLVFLLLLVISCLPSPTVRDLLKRLPPGKRRR